MQLITSAFLLLLALLTTGHAKWIPAQCPSPEELTALGSRLTGALVNPDDPDYEEAGRMLMNTRFNSDFGFVLFATSQDDIIEYVKFIRQFGLQPTIRSSGHDYIGRSAGDNTYHLSLQLYKEISVNLNDPESPTGASMVATTGNMWSDLYRRADEVRKIVLGGSAPTVTPGGYIQGGGHSPLTPTLGLGVDQVMRFTMVNVDAELMDVDKDGYTITRADGSMEYVADPEVYWAIMGGGGGTFGIVVNYKFILHEPPEDGFVTVLYTVGMDTIVGNRVAELTDKVSEVMLTKGDNWGGFIITNSFSPFPAIYNGTLTFLMLHWGGWDGAKDLAEDLLNWHPEWDPITLAVNVSTFWEYAQSIVDPVGFRTYIANRFAQTEDILVNDNLENLFQESLKYDVDIGCTGVMLGGAASVENPSTSVSPDFRSARLSLGCGVGWEREEDDEYYISDFNKFKENIYKIGRGVYFNEPDYELQNWKTDYWGSMETYDRLLAAKQKLDPHNILWCRNCVGSDLVDNETPCPVVE